MGSDENFFGDRPGADFLGGSNVGGAMQKMDEAERADLVTRLRRRVQEIDELLEGLGREEILDGEGLVWDVLARRRGADVSGLAGFTVYRTGESGQARIGVSPSLISGMSSAPVIPTLGGQSLDSLPLPTIPLPANGSWVAIRLDVEPGSRRITDHEYVITTGKIKTAEIRVYRDYAAIEGAARLPVIDHSDGRALRDGVFVIPLARLANGSPEQVGYIGPLGVVVCDSGALLVSSPWRAVPEATDAE